MSSSELFIKPEVTKGKKNLVIMILRPSQGLKLLVAAGQRARSNKTSKSKRVKARSNKTTILYGNSFT